MARIRMCILYYFANKEKLLVAGTGNKSEYLQGYFTLHGDIACDLLPLGNLYKTDYMLLNRQSIKNLANQYKSDIICRKCEVMVEKYPFPAFNFKK